MLKRTFITFFILSACGDDDSPAPSDFDSVDTLIRECPWDTDQANLASVCDLTLDPNKIFACPFAGSNKEVVVSGTPGATDPMVNLHVQNFTRGEEARLESDVDGSFGVVLPGKLKNLIGIEASEYNCVSRKLCLSVQSCEDLSL